MSEELITPESNDFAELQTKEQVRPAATFKGKPLAPYSRGTRILYNMVLSDQDLVIYRILAFLYIHLNPRSDVIPLAWGDVNKFREKIIEFRETLTDKDEQEAQQIVDDLLKADAETRVIPEPENEGKKKENEP